MNLNTIPDKSQIAARVRGRKLTSVQLLRGAAAAMVLVAHIIEHPQTVAPNATLMTGRLGVDIFFVVSGFIISGVSGSTSFDPRTFAIHRFFRVVPLYWATTLVVALCAAVLPALFKTTSFDASLLIKSLFFIPGHDPSNAQDWRPIYKLGWTINYEVFFYLVITSLFWCRTALTRAVIVTVTMAILIALSFGIKTGEKSLFSFYANVNIAPFLVGFWLGYADRAYGLRFRPLITAAFGAAAIALTALFYQFDFTELTSFVPHMAMTAASACILLTLVSAEDNIDWLSGGVLESIGDSSYSLYLLHMFIVGFFVAAVRHLGITGAAFWALLSLSVPVSLIAAHYSFVLLELPINRFGRRLSQNPWRRGMGK